MKINRACTCSKQVNPKLRIGDHRLLHTTSDFSSLSEAAAQLTKWQFLHEIKHATPYSYNTKHLAFQPVISHCARQPTLFLLRNITVLNPHV